tara:strand:+ start:1434 stop:2348 length:915 start_codon:yes stop_codon:yes gene_type:complete
MLKILMALSEIEKRILQLRFNTESISSAKKIDYQEYRLSKKQIISKLTEEGHKVSMVEITNFLKSKLGFRKSFDYGGEEKRSFVKGRPSKFYKTNDGIELKHQFGLYMYWYLFLQLAIKEKRKIDWSKYEDWGNAKSIAQTDWRDWWEKHKLLFDLKTNNGKLKYEMVLKKPEYESIYYAHKVYKMKKENEDLSFYELGLELEMKDELEKRKPIATFNNYSAWENFKKKIIKNIEEKGSDADLKIHKEFDDKKWERVYAKDLERIEGQLFQRKIKKQMFMFYHRGERILEGVCEGRFPEPRKWK